MPLCHGSKLDIKGTGKPRYNRLERENKYHSLLNPILPKTAFLCGFGEAEVLAL